MIREINGEEKQKLEDYFKSSFAVRRLLNRLKQYGNIDVDYEFVGFRAKEMMNNNFPIDIVINTFVADSKNMDYLLYSIQSFISGNEKTAKVYTCIDSYRSGVSRVYQETFFDLGDGFVLTKGDKIFPYGDSQMVELQVCDKKDPIYMSTDVLFGSLEKTKLGKKYKTNKMSGSAFIEKIQDNLGIERLEEENN